jgi:uncharacterized membrane protein HdeD (DUF308 family)
MTHTAFTESPFCSQVRREAGRMTWMGVALLALGIVALIFPVVSTLATTFFVGGIFVIAGLATIYGAFSIRGTGPFFGALLLGLLSLACGVFMLFRPGVGTVFLTMLVGLLFIFEGASELFVAFEARPSPGWRWMLFSAIASIVLAVIIISGWPGTALFTLGVLLGINFISAGIAYLALANSVKKAVRT